MSSTLHIGPMISIDPGTGGEHLNLKHVFTATGVLDDNFKGHAGMGTATSGEAHNNATDGIKAEEFKSDNPPKGRTDEAYTRIGVCFGGEDLIDCRTVSYGRLITRDDPELKKCHGPEEATELSNDLAKHHS